MKKGLASFLPLKSDALIEVMEQSISGLDQIVIITNNPNNSEDGLKILYVNDAFTNVTGYSQEEVVGFSPSMLQGIETSKETLTEIRNAIKNEKAFRCELLNYSKKKQAYWIELNMSPLSVNGKSCDYFIGYSFEITRFKNANRVARENKESLEFVLASAGLGYWDLDLIQNQTKRSLQHDNLFGHDELQKEWTYETFLAHVVEEDRERVNQVYTHAMNTGGDYDVEFRCKWPDASRHWLWSKGRFLKNEKGQVVRAAGIQADIDEKKIAEEKIYNLAFKDHLTQLANRPEFNKRLKNLLLKNEGLNLYSALLFIDLDDFKVVNDTLGHDVGDALLVKIARRLESELRNANIISRFGGDEFVVLVESFSSEISDAYNKVEEVLNAVRGVFQYPFYHKSQEFYSKASVGVTLFNDSSNSKFELLKQADLALYHAKSCGKNTHRFFNLKLQTDLIKRVAMENDLQKAIANNEFFLVYQPQVNVNNKIVGAEALIRWKHPEKGIISPAEFIPVAEDIGLIIPIGEWVLSEAVKFIKKWPGLGVSSECKLSVNISPVQFKHELFVARFASVLRNLKHQVGQLVLEITENTVISDLDEALLIINALKDQGITFSLDDFGSGFSSLNYLKLLPINEIKIDKSFIDDIVEDTRNLSILSAIINIASDLNLNLVIEGVESFDQFELLNNIGAQIYQGFYFSRPLAEAEFIEFLTSHA